MLAKYQALGACLTGTLTNGECDGWVHSHFESAINLFFPVAGGKGGQLVTLLASKRTLVPDGIRLSDAAFAMMLEAPVNSQVRLQKYFLSGESLPFPIHFGEVLQESPRIPVCDPEVLYRSIMLMRTKTNKPNGLKSLTADYWSRMKQLYRLTDSLRRGDTTTALYYLTQCAGAGPGLTPSTDDMIVGIITALRACGCCAPFPDAADVYTALEGITTDVGRKYICCALEGSVTQTLRDALAGSPVAWVELVNTGEYSGIDTLTGLAVGCRTCL